MSVAPDGPLAGPGGARIPARNLAVYREGYYDVRVPSDREGARGPWPDPLIPARDSLYGERRDAFPASAPADGDLVAWIDVHVPAGQRPGLYRGGIEVTLGTGQARRIPVTVRALGFSIPPTATLRNAFTIDAGAACEALTGAQCAANRESWRAMYLFARVALENRITVPNAYLAGPSGAPEGAQARLFDRYARPLIEGSARAPDPGMEAPALAGARLTALEAYGATYPTATQPADYGCAAPRSGCLAAWRGLAARFGFASRFFLYLCDEPGADPRARWPTCVRASRLAEAGGWPGVAKLVTTSIQSATAGGAEGLVDTLVVGVDQMANKPGYAYAGDQRPSYDAFLRRPGRALWIYTACLQTSCDRSPGAYSRGWPGYAIDQPPSQARAMGWLAFEYGASGELYYSVDASLAGAWRDQYRFGGNGDGNLFYPGLPAGDAATGAPAIGGSHVIPIESIRMKRIRDGREDYEYLRLAAARGLGTQAATAAAGLLGGPARATYGASFTQRRLDDARCHLAQLLSSGVAACH